MTVDKKKLKKFIFYFDKSVFFVFTCLFIFGYAKILYSPDLIEKATVNAGMSILELVFVMGVLLGLWTFFSFLLLVFVNYNEVMNEKNISG
jgi:hypothetical protein